MPIALLALTLSAFAIGTTEFVIVGLIPTMATDLGVSIPSAGYLSAFTLWVSLLALLYLPLLQATGRVRKCFSPLCRYLYWVIFLLGRLPAITL